MGQAIDDAAAERHLPAAVGSRPVAGGRVCAWCEATPAGCASVHLLAGRRCCEACDGVHEHQLELRGEALPSAAAPAATDNGPYPAPPGEQHGSADD